MKQVLLGTLFVATFFNAFADASGDVGCSWGNMLFRGRRGAATHVVAATTNGTFGNNTFGMTTGTNGCHANGTLSYGGKSLLVFSSMMDELSEDMAKGNDEALITYTVVLGARPQDREHFVVVTHEHFSEISNKSDATAADVYANTQAILKQDVRLAERAEQA